MMKADRSYCCFACETRDFVGCLKEMGEKIRGAAASEGGCAWFKMIAGIIAASCVPGVPQRLGCGKKQEPFSDSREADQEKAKWCARLKGWLEPLGPDAKQQMKKIALQVGLSV